MPNWRKVIVSGSDAKLSSITVPGPEINQLTASVAITALNTYNSTALNSGTVQRFETATASWYVEHNLNEFWPIVYVWQEDPDYVYTPIITDNIQIVSQNALRINFPSALKGYVNISRAGHVVSGSVEWANLIGQANVTASVNVYGNVIANQGFTGSLLGTSSYANTSSYINPLQQTVTVTGSLEVTGSYGNTFAVLSALQVTSSGYLVLPNFASLQFADDAAAALGGVPIGGVYLCTGAYSGTQPFLTVRLA